MHSFDLRPIQSVSVLIPTWQGMEFLERVLDALARQKISIPWDVWLIDSGSSDGTLAYALERASDFPVEFHAYGIPQVEFDHGDTRNLLAALSSGDLLVFLSQDAIPSNYDWLATLVRNFESPRVGAAYCRNIPREESLLLTKLFTRTDPGYAPERVEVRFPDETTYALMSDEERRVLLNFNDVASAIRRELWEYYPFPRTMMGEDVLIARAILEAGYITVYDSDAIVDHSHDYDEEKMRWRGGVDARFNAEWLNRISMRERSEVEVLAQRLANEDRELLESYSLSPQEQAELGKRSLELRTAMLQGMFEGGESKQRYPYSFMRRTTQLVVMIAMPFDVTPGVRQHFAKLGEELEKRGHNVALVALGLGAASPNDGASAHSGWQGFDGTRSEFLSMVLKLEVDVVHFVELSSKWGELVADLKQHQVAVLATCLEFPDDPKLLAPADFCSTPNDKTFEALKQTDLFTQYWLIPYRSIVISQTDSAVNQSSNSPTDLHAEVAELEYRYRGLACIDQDLSGRRFMLGAWNFNDETFYGRKISQAGDWMVLLAGSAVSYSIAGLPAGPVRLIIELLPFDSPKITGGLGRAVIGTAQKFMKCVGRALIDGEQIAHIERPFKNGNRGSVPWIIEFDLPEGASQLRIEASSNAYSPRTYLRMRPIRLESHRTVSSGSGSILHAAEKLRVQPGAALTQAVLPKAAIIIPNLDGGKVLEECLTSIAALDYPRDRIEVHLVDNASKDGSIRLARKLYPEIMVHEQASNLGFGGACNLGAEHAEADVLVFLNNDIRFGPEFLNKLVAPIVRNECHATSAKMLNWDGKHIDGAGTGSNLFGIAVQHGYGAPPGPEHEIPRRTLFPCGGAMAIDTKCFRASGGFDAEFFAYYEDLDLGWRLWVMGYEVHYVPDAECQHRHSHTSERLPREAVRRAMIRNSLLACIKNYDDENLGRIFPAMLALATQRATLHTGLDRSDFQLERAALETHIASQPQRMTSIAALGAADLLAIQDVLGNLGHWLNRRRSVQELRKRSDADIMSLFLEPDARAETDETYQALQSQLFTWLRLNQLD